MSKDILHLTEEPTDYEVHFALEQNQTGSLPFIDTQEAPVSNFEENLSNSLPFVYSQTTPIVQSISDNLYLLKSHHHKEFVDINAKIKALKVKTFFMNEICTLRQDLSSMQENHHQTTMLIEKG